MNKYLYKYILTHFNLPLTYGYLDIGRIYSSGFYMNQTEIDNFIKNYSVLFKFGNLLKNKGDVLLCPVSEGFKLSNPLSQKINKIENLNVEKWITDARMNPSVAYRSNHCLFLPLQKLKYRAIVLIEMDFYSELRREINLSRVIESFTLLKKFNCCKLSIPKDMLYDHSRYNGLRIQSELHNIYDILKGYNSEIDFLIEVVINTYNEPDFMYYSRDIKYTAERYPYSKKLYSFMKDPSDSMFYPKEYLYWNTEANLIKKVLTNRNIQLNDLSFLIKILEKKQGDYFETGVGRSNLGYKKELISLLDELPWNADVIKEVIGPDVVLNMKD